MLKYSALHYDERLLLKVPPLLWLSILYGIRHFFIVGAAKLMPMDIVTVPWINMQASIYFMLTDLPAVLVLLAIGHRVPNGVKFMRWVWKHGRWLLMSSYMAGIVLFAYLNNEILFDPDSWDFMDGLFVVMIDFAFVGYLVRSELVRDVFNDFPNSTETQKIAPPPLQASTISAPVEESIQHNASLPRLDRGNRE